MKTFEFSEQAERDLTEIWRFIADDNVDAADRVRHEMYQTVVKLAGMPRMGHRRRDLTTRDVYFWPVFSYLIVYLDAVPLKVVRILHAKRDVGALLGQP